LFLSEPNRTQIRVKLITGPRRSSTATTATTQQCNNATRGAGSTTMQTAPTLL